LIEEKDVEGRGRRSFPNFKVEAAFFAQDGCCSRCGSTLEFGFHRHHRNGDAGDNSLENLELLCPRCHRATVSEALNLYTQRLEWAIGALTNLVEKALEGKLAGNTAEAIREAIALTLKYERELVGVAPPESPPPTITFLKKLQETRLLEEVYLEAFKQGLECGIKARFSLGDSKEIR
jgi:hypothetical protein